MKNKDMNKAEAGAALRAPLIPAGVDPIALADAMKGDMAAEWLKRKEKLKVPLARQF